MNNGPILSILLLTLGLGATIYFFYSKRVLLYQKRWLPLIFCGTAVFLSYTVPFIISQIRYMNDESFQGIQITNDNLDQMEIVKVGNTQTLVVGDARSAVVYEQLNRPVSYKTYEPVYLQEFDLYYLVIYSSIQSSYEIPYFRQADYSHSVKPDTLVLIHKDTGKLIPLNIYEIIGRRIDLRMIQMEGHFLAIPVLNHYQQFAGIMIGIAINPGFLTGTQGNPHTTTLMAFSSHDEPNWYIETFAISSNNLLLFVDSEKTVYLEQHVSRFFVHSSQAEMHRNLDSPLKEIALVKAGYFTHQFGNIYYVGDDLILYMLNDLTTSTEVASITSLDDWKSFIPTP